MSKTLLEMGLREACSKDQDTAAADIAERTRGAAGSRPWHTGYTGGGPHRVPGPNQLEQSNAHFGAYWWARKW
ncbi:MAG: hypothetical protein AMJ93_02640 [Anaerolineae bacterium SM23_84]|nr:MAG: hypothetical protein AMJ93_02640 [Anaerolineae bacterium SM23_84]